MSDFINGAEDLNPAKIAASVAFDLRKEVKTNFRGCRDDTAIAAADVIEGLMRQRDELLEALKGVGKWSDSLDRIMPTWLESKVDDAIANAEK